MLQSNKPTFLYPTARQFLVDEVCEHIVRELEKRNWKVPGIEVELDIYGSGEQKLRLVRHIRGKDFHLWFCRGQGRIANSNWNDSAGVMELAVPGHKISIFEDFSGPTYYRYTGKNWKKDRAQFLTGDNFKSQKYSGRSTRGSVLVADYIANAESYLTKDILTEIRDWLTKHVLNAILAQPEQEQILEQEIYTPFPSDKIGPLFTYGEEGDVERILLGQSDIDELEPGYRFAMIGSGHRLVPFDASNDGTVPKIAYDGFMWCAFGEVNPETKLEDLPKEIGRFYRHDRRYVHVIRIMPKYAEGVFIADMAPGDKYREEQWKTTDRLSDAQLREYYRCAGRTIIPVTEYKGGFEKPVVLINRELDFDEVEVVASIQTRPLLKA